MSTECTCVTGIVGTEHSLAFEVNESDFASELGSGDLQVLGTPRLVAWMESVTVALLERTQEPRCTSLGIHVDVRHQAPSIQGDHLEIIARVEEVTGSKINFSTKAMSHGQEVGVATITRAHVNREKFLRRVAES